MAIQTRPGKAVHAGTRDQQCSDLSVVDVGGCDAIYADKSTQDLIPPAGESAAAIVRAAPVGQQVSADDLPMSVRCQ